MRHRWVLSQPCRGVAWDPFECWGLRIYDRSNAWRRRQCFQGWWPPIYIIIKLGTFREGLGVCALTCLLAGIPTSLWPSSVKATVEGVVLIPRWQVSDQIMAHKGQSSLPSAFSITRGLFPSIIATHELVVPRSIPITLYDKQLYL
jgi:hypothetical protein